MYRISLRTRKTRLCPPKIRSHMRIILPAIASDVSWSNSSYILNCKMYLLYLRRSASREIRLMTLENMVQPGIGYRLSKMASMQSHFGIEKKLGEDSCTFPPI